MSVAHIHHLSQYKRNGDTFTKLANPRCVAYWHGWNSMVTRWKLYECGAYTSPFITIYKRNGDTFTKLANPDVLPTGDGWNSLVTRWIYECGAYFTIPHHLLHLLPSLPTPQIQHRLTTPTPTPGKISALGHQPTQTTPQH